MELYCERRILGEMQNGHKTLDDLVEALEACRGDHLLDSEYDMCERLWAETK